MLAGDKIWMAQGDNPCYLKLNKANRHGLIAGATGTGKTVTLKVMAEGFSQAGVPVFMADVKGDVTGIAAPGEDNEGMQKRIKKFGIEGWKYQGCPSRFWSLDGQGGIPIRITVSDMGPDLLSRMMQLTDVQSGVLSIAFRIADDQQLLLIDLKDLRALLNYLSKHVKDYEMEYGHITSQSVATIMRQLVKLEEAGAATLFGEPNLDLNDWFATDANGQGYVNVLDATQLVNKPTTYAMFLLWMLSDLFETLPEVGDPDKPKFVFFFDEAHLLFDGMPKELTDKVIQVVRLIRSKGVGVYFITQSPSDIPDDVLSQLSNRIQHGLRAYTPAEQKAVKAAAQAFRENPNFDSAEAMLNLGTGEALVSFLDDDGRPEVVENAKILPPQCLMAPAPADVRQKVADSQSNLMGKYGTAVDPESAFEKLAEEAKKEAEAAELEAQRAELEKERAELEKEKAKAEAKAAREAEKRAERKERAHEREMEKMKTQAMRQGMNFLGSVLRGSVGKSVGRGVEDVITRGILGNILH